MSIINLRLRRRKTVQSVTGPTGREAQRIADKAAKYLYPGMGMDEFNKAIQKAIEEARHE